jgi:hypothetical protein
MRRDDFGRNVRIRPLAGSPEATTISVQTVSSSPDANAHRLRARPRKTPFTPTRTSSTNTALTGNIFPASGVAATLFML